MSYKLVIYKQQKIVIYKQQKIVIYKRQKNCWWMRKFLYPSLSISLFVQT